MAMKGVMRMVKAAQAAKAKVAARWGALAMSTKVADRAAVLAAIGLAVVASKAVRARMTEAMMAIARGAVMEAGRWGQRNMDLQEVRR